MEANNTVPFWDDSRKIAKNVYQRSTKLSFTCSALSKSDLVPLEVSYCCLLRSSSLPFAQSLFLFCAAWVWLSAPPPCYVTTSILWNKNCSKLQSHWLQAQQELGLFVFVQLARICRVFCKSNSEETMVKFLLWATFGLCFLKLCEAQTRKYCMNENANVCY